MTSKDGLEQVNYVNYYDQYEHPFLVLSALIVCRSVVLYFTSNCTYTIKTEFGYAFYLHFAAQALAVKMETNY